jgi:molybdate transport system substrate-binding protein
MPTSIRLISSMATRQLVEDLVAGWIDPDGARVVAEAVGGVDAARRVRAGEPFDIVMLAANAIDALIADGKVVAGSRIDLVDSGVAVAVRAGAPRPEIGSEAALRAAVLGAASVGYSTGPSGVALTNLFGRWGIAEAVAARLVQAPPGVPVGSLVADGRVALGFQQLSELMHVDGIDVLGPMPPAIQITTTFSAGIGVAAGDPAGARRFIAYMAAPEAAPIKQRNGMEPARSGLDPAA